MRRCKFRINSRRSDLHAAQNLQDHVRERLPALRREGKEEGAHGVDLQAFFDQAPAMHPNSALIKGVVCGVRVEDVADPLMQKVRYLDKLVDELAKGKAIEKILRSTPG